jgi:hypothetical protein
VHTGAREHAGLPGALGGSTLAASRSVLFAVFLISLLVAVGLGVYFAGGLLAGRSRNITGFTVPPATPYVSLANPPPPAVRVARGTTPPPFVAPTRASSPVPAGVVSSRQDSTQPDADARFSVKRASQRRF